MILLLSARPVDAAVNHRPDSAAILFCVEGEAVIAKDEQADAEAG